MKRIFLFLMFCLCLAIGVFAQTSGSRRNPQRNTHTQSNTRTTSTSRANTLSQPKRANTRSQSSRTSNNVVRSQASQQENSTPDAGNQSSLTNSKIQEVRKTETVIEQKVPVENAIAELENKVYTSVEQMPRFSGGDGALMKHIASHLQYPPMAQEQGIQGKVIVQFVVTKTGNIGEVKVVRSLSPDCDNEAKRVVKGLPLFTPGKQNGQPVNVWYTLSVTFKPQN